MNFPQVGSVTSVLDGTALYSNRNASYASGTSTSKGGYPERSSSSGGGYSSGGASSSRSGVNYTGGNHHTGGEAGSFSHTSGYNSGAGNSGGSCKFRKVISQCDHCGCKGQTRENCYKLVGYPTDFKSRKKLGNSGAYVNQVEIFENATPTKSTPIAFFTKNQYQQILQLLSKTCEGGGEATTAKATSAGSDLLALNFTCDNNAWIVDTGATNHMTSRLELLSKYDLVPTPHRSKVHLSTGNTVSVSHVGTSCVFDNQNISNVLFLPDFKYNLLSVSKITKELQCMVSFLPDFCGFQDLCSGQVTGIGRESVDFTFLKKDQKEQIKHHVSMSRRYLSLVTLLV